MQQVTDNTSPAAPLAATRSSTSLIDSCWGPALLIRYTYRVEQQRSISLKERLQLQPVTSIDVARL